MLRTTTTEPAWRIALRKIGVFPATVWAVFFVLVMLVANGSKPVFPYTVNQKISQPIVARVDFKVADPELAASNIRAAREAVPSRYRVNTELIDRAAGDLTAMYEAAQAETFERFQQRAAEATWPANEELYTRLHEADEEIRTAYMASIEKLRAALRHEHIVRPTSSEDRDPSSKAVNILVQYSGGDSEASTTEQVAKLNLVQIASADHIAFRAETLARSFDRDLRSAVAAYLTTVLSRDPVLVFDRTSTLEAMASAEKSAPPGERFFEKGKPFVFPSRLKNANGEIVEDEEAGLTRAEIELLEVEAQEYQKFLNSDDPAAIKLRERTIYESIGVGMVLCVLSISLFVYVGMYHHRVFDVPTRALAFVGLLVACLIAARSINPRFALTPVLLAASILTIAYPRRFAAGVTVIFVVIVALVMRADMGTMVMLFACGYATALMLNDIRTRTKIITAGMVTGVIAFFTGFAFGLINHQEPKFALTAAAYAAGNAILAALIIQGALPFVERIFRVATALTLLEYRDANRPLLQSLAREAPGTYNHSLVLGTMAEAACKAIGADGLLAHVGALYHDIGKIPKAEYFTENQEASINRHDQLAPSMSLLIILGHVKDGLELAREYGLPRVLYPFIAEHHGTTVVRYFHHMASEKQPKIASGKHDREVAEAEFRYPGPKPQSKETAVLMLCDGVEGAVRSLQDPTAGRIESVVSQVMQARLKDGQFDECDITLRELHKVEESVVKSLCTFYHGRVSYPKENKDPKDTNRGESGGHAAKARDKSTQLAG
ncbi:MAG: HDIG domain-containing protein [Phycisphaerales bacterium]|nr:HDIG domain-containing protein [Phycisphaerales bacterium]